MKLRSIFTAAAIACATLMAFPSHGKTPVVRAATAPSAKVPSKEINGTWRNERNTFKIWVLEDGTLRIAFQGTYESKTEWVRISNAGEANGIAALKGDTAVLPIAGNGKGGRITLKFSGGSLVAKQTGDCGFGRDVSADGTYRRVSRWKPRFEK